MKAKMVCRALVVAALLAGWSVGPAAAQQDKDQRLQVLLKLFSGPEKPAAAMPEEVRLRQALADYTAKLNELAAELAAVEQKRTELKVQLASLDEKAHRLRGQMKSLEAERERLLARIKQGQGPEAANRVPAQTGDKLDKILQKLDALEKRLADLEKKVK